MGVAHFQSFSTSGHLYQSNGKAANGLLWKPLRESVCSRLLHRAISKDFTAVLYLGDGIVIAMFHTGLPLPKLKTCGLHL